MDLPDPGIEPGPPALEAGSLPAELPGKPVNLQKQARFFLKNKDSLVRNLREQVSNLGLSKLTVFSQVCEHFRISQLSGQSKRERNTFIFRSDLRVRKGWTTHVPNGIKVAAKLMCPVALIILS